MSWFCNSAAEPATDQPRGFELLGGARGRAIVEELDVGRPQFVEGGRTFGPVDDADRERQFVGVPGEFCK